MFFVFLIVSVYVCMFACIPVCMYVCNSVCLPVCLPVCTYMYGKHKFMNTNSKNIQIIYLRFENKSEHEGCKLHIPVYCSNQNKTNHLQTKTFYLTNLYSAVYTFANYFFLICIMLNIFLDKCMKLWKFH